MNHDEIVAQAKAALDAAKAAEAALNQERDAEIRAAKEAIEAKYRERLAAAVEVKQQAFKALRAAEADRARANAHEWEGKTVERAIYVWDRMYRNCTQRGTERGVVFTYTGFEEYPETMSKWGAPKVGETWVRLLKKNGKPGIRVVKLKESRLECGPWKLAEA